MHKRDELEFYLEDLNIRGHLGGIDVDRRLEIIHLIMVFLLWK